MNTNYRDQGIINARLKGIYIKTSSRARLFRLHEAGDTIWYMTDVIARYSRDFPLIAHQAVSRWDLLQLSSCATFHVWFLLQSGLGLYSLYCRQRVTLPHINLDRVVNERSRHGLQGVLHECPERIS